MELVEHNVDDVAIEQPSRLRCCGDFPEPGRLVQGPQELSVRDCNQPRRDPIGQRKDVRHSWSLPHVPRHKVQAVRETPYILDGVGLSCLENTPVPQETTQASTQTLSVPDHVARSICGERYEL